VEDQADQQHPAGHHPEVRRARQAQWVNPVEGRCPPICRSPRPRPVFGPGGPGVTGGTRGWWIPQAIVRWRRRRDPRGHRSTSGGVDALGNPWVPSRRLTLHGYAGCFLVYAPRRAGGGGRTGVPRSAFGWTVLLLVGTFALGSRAGPVRRSSARSSDLQSGLAAPRGALSDGVLVALGSILTVVAGARHDRAWRPDAPAAHPAALARPAVATLAGRRGPVPRPVGREQTWACRQIGPAVATTSMVRSWTSSMVTSTDATPVVRYPAAAHRLT